MRTYKLRGSVVLLLFQFLFVEMLPQNLVGPRAGSGKSSANDVPPRQLYLITSRLQGTFSEAATRGDQHSSLPQPLHPCPEAISKNRSQLQTINLTQPFSFFTISFLIPP